MMQERAEIQNMIVLQHWSFEELRTLFGTANDEARRDSISPSSEDPPPRYDDPAVEGVRLAVTGPQQPSQGVDTSMAVVQYQEQPLPQLDESLQRAVTKENSALCAPVPDIVIHLLHEWTQPEFPDHSGHPDPRALAHTRPSTKNRKYMPHISDDEEDTTESEYEELDEHARGYYLEGPLSHGTRKSVRFRHQQARVEDDIDEESHRFKRPSHKHILNSDESSSDSSEASTLAHRSHHRRDSNSSASRQEFHSHAPNARMSRPYTSGPSGPRNSPPEKEVIRPASSHGRPPPGMHPRAMPMHMPNQPWQGQAPNSPGLRPPPQFNGPPGQPQRMPSAGPYVPQQYMHSPGASPNAPQGAYFPPRQSGPPQSQGPPPNMSQQRPSRPRSNHSSRQSSDRADRDKKSASRNIKKGIGIGAAAAGLMELLSGLDGI